MLLSEVLHPGTVKIDLSASERFAAIEELVDTLVEAHEIPLAMRDTVIDAVVHREREESTGLEYGIAVPHATLDRVEDIIAAFAVLPKGIAWESKDGLPARMIALLLLPKRNYPGRAETLAGIAHLGQDAALRNAVLSAKDNHAVLTALKDAEGTLAAAAR